MPYKLEENIFEANKTVFNPIWSYPSAEGISGGGMEILEVS